MNSSDVFFQIAALRSTVRTKRTSKIPYFVMHMLDVGIQSLPLVVLLATCGDMKIMLIFFLCNQFFSEKNNFFSRENNLHSGHWNLIPS